MNSASRVDSAAQLAARLSSLQQVDRGRPSTYEVLTHLESSKTGVDGPQQLRLWTAQICGGLAIGLFPYTPGLVQSCKPDNNPGWLCAARAATFIAASGATLIGVLATVAFCQNRRWLTHHACELGAVVGTSSETPEATVRAALVDYLKMSCTERQRVRQLCQPKSGID